MDTQPKIPTLKDSQKPQVKVRGLEAGVTLFDRLKQFKKKDLAFILAGLGTLFMAPLAEHFMMSPETGDGSQLTAGWKGGAGGKGGMFDGSGSSPYEPGVSGLAPGSAVGGGSDIITPLNVRDPSALVMGPGATQQPPTNSVMPSTPPPTAPTTHSDSDLKDALAASARGVGAAAHAAKALLPIPKIALAGQGGLRGLGVVSGGSSATASPISSAGLVTGKAAQGNNLGGVTGGKNITGVSRGQTNGSGTSAMDALKAAGDKAAGAFNRGPAADGLNTAAGTAIPTGGAGAGGAGAGGSGVTDKPDSGNSNKDGKSVGESLAFLKQKAMQEAQIALWAKEQEAGDSKLEGLKIRNTMAESIAGSVASAVGGQIGCLIVPSGTTCVNAPGGATSFVCNVNGTLMPFPASTIGKGPGDCAMTQAVPGTGANGAGGTGATNGKLLYSTDGTNYVSCGNTGSPPAGSYSCLANGPVASGPAKPGTTPPGVHDFGGMSSQPMTGLKDACAALTSFQSNLKNDPKIAQTDAVKATEQSISDLLGQAQTLVQIRDAIGTPSATAPTGSISSSGDCQAATLPNYPAGDGPMASQMTIITGANSLLLAPNSGILARMNSAVTSTDPKTPDPAALANDVGDGTPKAAGGAPGGVTGQIAAFTADLGILQTAYSGVTAKGSPDLGIPLLQVQFKQSWNPTVAAGATAAQNTIQQAVQTTGSTLSNLNTASTNLQKQVPLLQGSVGANGTVTLLVASNQGADTIGSQPGNAGIKSPLVAPVIQPPAQNAPSPDGTIATMQTDLQKASGKDGKSGDIGDATTKVTTFQAVTPPPTTCTGPCTDANTAMALVGTDINTIRADQSAINSIISNGVTTAGKLIGQGTTP